MHTTSIWSVVVAVAVIASTLTLVAIRLRTSSILDRAPWDVSLVQSTMQIGEVQTRMREIYIPPHKDCTCNCACDCVPGFFICILYMDTCYLRSLKYSLPLLDSISTTKAQRRWEYISSTSNLLHTFTSKCISGVNKAVNAVRIKVAGTPIFAFFTI